MGYKFKITTISIVLLIGVGCIGGGLGTIIGYIYGNNNLSLWVGKVPMSFSTAVFISFIGLALYLIGKYVLRHDQSVRQV